MNPWSEVGGNERGRECYAPTQSTKCRFKCLMFVARISKRQICSDHANQTVVSLLTLVGQKTRRTAPPPHDAQRHHDRASPLGTDDFNLHTILALTNETERLVTPRSGLVLVRP